jgi:hypothetical protein
MVEPYVAERAHATVENIGHASRASRAAVR